MNTMPHLEVLAAKGRTQSGAQMAGSRPFRCTLKNCYNLMPSLRDFFLGLQTPSKKVLWSVFRGLNTFLEGIWSPRVYTPVPFLRPLYALGGYGLGTQESTR